MLNNIRVYNEMVRKISGHRAIIVDFRRRSLLSNALSAPFVVKRPNPHRFRRPASRLLDVLFCLSRNLDPIGSSFRSNVFDKTLTSRCFGKEWRSGKEGRTFADDIGIQKCKLLSSKREVRKHSICVLITRCAFVAMPRWSGLGTSRFYDQYKQWNPTWRLMANKLGENSPHCMLSESRGQRALFPELLSFPSASAKHLVTKP